MSTAVEISVGTKLEYNTTGSTWVELTDVFNADGPKKKRKSIPLPALNDAFVAKKAGRLDNGEYTFTCGWTKTVYGILLGLMEANTSKNYRFTYADLGSTASTDAFTGRIIGLGNKVPNEDAITFDVTIDISDSTTFTAGT